MQIVHIKPKQSPLHNRPQDLFYSELSQIINPRHSLLTLAQTVDWNRLDELVGATCRPDESRSAIIARPMVSLRYLQYMHNLSNEDVLPEWVGNPS